MIKVGFFNNNALIKLLLIDLIQQVFIALLYLAISKKIL